MADKTAVERLVRVEVLDKPIIPGRSGVKNGNAWTIPPCQVCAIWQDDPFPIQLEVPVPDAGPYRPGFYLLTGAPLVAAAVNDRGGNARLRINFNDRTVALVSVEEVVAALGKPDLKLAKSA